MEKKHFTLEEDGGLILDGISSDILHTYEHIPAEIFANSDDACAAVADEIVKAVKEKKDGLFRLGLSTGKTPLSLYRELVARHKAGKISFAGVEVYSIDEYYPIAPTAAQSRNRRIREELLDQVDIRKENIHIPDGSIAKEEMAAWCADYDQKARHLDLLVIGVGEKGQIGFNEAGSSPSSRTRNVLLSYSSRKRQAKNFNGDMKATPTSAITIGISTMLSARRIILSNIKTEADENEFIIAYDHATKRGWEHYDNAVICALRMLDWLGIEHVTIAGFDGFRHVYNESYADPTLPTLKTDGRWDELNEEIRDMFREFKANAAACKEITMLTESYFE